MLQKMRGSNQKGFTLIELMIVIAIIGILSAIAIPNFLSYRTKGQDTAAQLSGKNFYNTSMAYFAEQSGSGAITVNSSNPPTGFNVDSNVVISGGITDTNGTITTDATFSHNRSSTTYTLATDGSLS